MNFTDVDGATWQRVQERAAQANCSVDELLNHLLDNDDPSCCQRMYRMEQIIDKMPLAIALFDTGMRYLLVNEAWREQYRLNDINIIGRSHYAVFPEIGDDWKEIHRRCLQGEVSIKDHAPFPRQDGTLDWIKWEVRPWYVDVSQMQIGGLMMLTEVITEQKRAEEELRVKESAIASSITPIALADLNGQLTYVNDAFLKMWKLDSADEVIGHSVLEFWASQEAAQAVVGTLMKKGNYVGELTARLSDDSTAFIELAAAIVRDRQGNPICMMGSFNDITHRKQAEAYAVENERLKTQFKREQEQNALILRIVSMLSHDLRTPLAVISSARDILAHYYHLLNEDKRQEKLDVIQRQIQFAKGMIEDTVNIARGNLGGQEFNPTEVNLVSLCKISVEEIRAAQGSDYDIIFISQHEVEVAYVDEVLVSRILLNLLSNAIKYSPAGGKIIMDVIRNDRWILLRVSDQGIGVSATDLPHIFEPFYRTRDAQHIRGTGLGLNIVKDCVDRHRGDIHVSSVPGQGSTFTVVLPASLDVVAPARSSLN